MAGINFKGDKVALIEQLEYITSGYYTREKSPYFVETDLTVKAILEAIADYQG